ncbi:hypothetical protein PG990_007237 [Apiospora arundinis]
MCFLQYTTLICPGCNYHHPYSIDVPIHCPESLLEPRPGFGLCAGGVKQTFRGLNDDGKQLAVDPAGKSEYHKSQARVKSLFAQMPKPLDEGAARYEYALREYALTCLYNPHELREGGFEPLATTRPGWDGGHTAEIQDTTCVRGGAMTYRMRLQNLGESLLRHSCNE